MVYFQAWLPWRILRVAAWCLRKITVILPYVANPENPNGNHRDSPWGVLVKSWIITMMGKIWVTFFTFRTKVCPPWNWVDFPSPVKLPLPKRYHSCIKTTTSLWKIAISVGKSTHELWAMASLSSLSPGNHPFNLIRILFQLVAASSHKKSLRL